MSKNQKNIIMKERLLGKELKVSAVGFGCMGLTHAYGPTLPKNEAVKLIQEAANNGHIFFDTAECYIGTYANGETAYNEEAVGEALKPFRDKVVIATKFGVRHTGQNALAMDSSPAAIRKAVEGSLKRLGTDYIDLYYQHRIDPKVEPETVAEVMNQLIKEGKIRYWGISETTEDYLRRANAVCKVTAIQNRYSMMARWYESIFPVLEELEVGFVAFSPLANGILSNAYGKGSTFEAGDYRNIMPQYKSEAYEVNKELFTLIENMAKEKNATSAQISLAWMLAKKPYIVPIPGSTKPARIAENAGAADIVLSIQELADLEAALNKLPMSGVFGEESK